MAMLLVCWTKIQCSLDIPTAFCSQQRCHYIKWPHSGLSRTHCIQDAKLSFIWQCNQTCPCIESLYVLKTTTQVLPSWQALGAYCILPKIHRLAHSRWCRSSYHYTICACCALCAAHCALCLVHFVPWLCMHVNDGSQQESINTC